MAKQKTSSAVAKTNAAVPAPVANYGADAGAGHENTRAEDLIIPFIALLQDDSTALESDESLEAGMLFNTVTEDRYDGEEGLVFVPACIEHIFKEWAPRKKGGGFLGKHSVDSEIVKKAIAEAKEFGDNKTPEGNELKETYDIYGLLLDADGEEAGMAIISFSSSKIKVYRRWMTKVNMFTIKTPDGAKQRPPVFAHKVRLGSKDDKNKGGDEFKNFTLQPAIERSMELSLLMPDSPVLARAKELKEMVESGMVKAAEDTQTKAEGTEGGGGEPKASKNF